LRSLDRSMGPVHLREEWGDGGGKDGEGTNGTTPSEGAWEEPANILCHTPS
jgi:hypothetical protein